MDSDQIINENAQLRVSLTIVMEVLLEVVGRNPYTTCANSTNADRGNYI
jgi:hypothetical protein